MNPLLLCAALACSAPGDDERLLRDAGLPADGDGLVAFFRARTPSEDDRARLADLVKQLGDDDFDTRETATKALRLAGRGALTPLRAALAAGDPERARRARELVGELERVPHGPTTAAAARTLAARRPDDSPALLLAYLPFADEEYLEEELFDVLAGAGLKDGVPGTAIKAAVKDAEPLRRAAAARALGRAAPAHRGPLVGLLKDAAPRVRFEAALALVRGGDRAGVAALLRQLAEAPLPLAWRAEDVLLRVAGDRAPAATLGKGGDPERRACRDAWEKWWDANGSKLDLAKLDLGSVAAGLTLWCEDEKVGESPGWVMAVNHGKAFVWRVEGMNSPADFHLLPGGRVLAAENWHSKVTERDRTGKVLWEQKLPDKPVSCERLPSGNTFVATYSGLHEFTPDGKEVLSLKATGMLHGGYKLRSGNVLTVDVSGNVVERDAAGKEIHQFRPEKYAEGAGGWASVEVLANGRYLIALSGTGRVVETDNTGKILWDAAVQSPTSATRLRNGNTLVSSVDGGFVVELDAEGKEVWRCKTPGRPFRVRRY